MAFTEMKMRAGELEFSALTAGFEENPGGDVVICLHGFPDNARSFRFQMPALAEAGYRVLCPTLRGYEPSSQPADNDYSLDALAGDVVAWIDHLGVEKVHLVGHDWGSAITFLAGALTPERFHSVTGLAVPSAGRFVESLTKVPRQVLRSWYMVFFQVPRLSNRAVESRDWALVKRLWRKWSPGFELPDTEWNHLRTTFEAPGVNEAMLSYYRQNASVPVILGLSKPQAVTMTTVPVRALAVTGADDGCVDTRVFDHAIRESDFPRGVRLERMAATGHFAHQERPDEFNSVLLEWLSER